MLIAQISDTHISLPGVGPDALFETAAHLEAAVAHLRKLSSPIDALIVSGDLVEAGSETEYARLRVLLKPLNVPVYLVPGNHDDSDRLRESFRDWGYFPAEGKLYYVIDDFAVRFVILDSSVPGHAHGTLGAKQLLWLDEQLADQPDRPTVIVLHHPPFRSGMRRMDMWSLSDASELETLVSKFTNVHRVVCGHLHRHMIRRFGGSVVQVCPSTAQQLSLDLADAGGTLTVRMEPPTALLHHWDGLDLVTHQICLKDYELKQTISFASKC